MAGSWHGYRPLVAGGRRFRWRCAFADPWSLWFAGAAERATWLDRVLVRPEDDPGRLLSVHWPVGGGPAVTPGLVRACVDEAARRGWPGDHRTLALDGSEASHGGGDGGGPRA